MRSKVLSVALSVVVGLTVAELGVLVFLGYFATDEQLFRYGTLEQVRERGIRDRFSPHRHLGYVPTTNWKTGTDRHNSGGFRGDEIQILKPPGVFRIACLGGSTTYGNKVDNPDDSYPGALQAELRERGRSVEVLNAGCHGYSSLQSLINLQIRILEYSPDLVIVYHGVNDVHPRLVWPPSAYRRDQSGHILPGTFNPSLWEESALARALAVRTGLIEPQASLTRAYWGNPKTAYALEFWRQMRDERYPQGFFVSVPVSRMLSTNTPLHFERNLQDIVAAARGRNAEVVLMTWALSVEVLTGDDPRLESAEYQNAIREQNAVARGVAKEFHTGLVDLAEETIPVRYYVDGYHFSAEGNRFRAGLLADLIERKYLTQAEGRLSER